MAVRRWLSTVAIMVVVGAAIPLLDSPATAACAQEAADVLAAGSMARRISLKLRPVVIG